MVVPCSYMSVLTLIRAKEEDSGNYTMRVENGDRSGTVGLILEVKGWCEPVITFTYFALFLTCAQCSCVSLLLCKEILTNKTENYLKRLI